MELNPLFTRISRKDKQTLFAGIRRPIGHIFGKSDRELAKQDVAKMNRLQLYLISFFLLAATLAGNADALNGELDARQLQAFIAEGRFQQVIEYFEDESVLETASPAAQFALSQAYYYTEAYKKSVERLSALIDDGFESSAIQNWYGKALVQAGLKSNVLKRPFFARRARKALERAVELDSTNTVARQDLLKYYLLAPGFLGGDDNKALQQAEALRALNSWEGFKAYGTLYFHRKEYASAERELLAAIDSYPADIQFYEFLSEIYREAQEFDKLINTYLQAARHIPEARSSFLLLALELAVEINQCDNLLQSLAAETATPLNDPQVYYYIGLAAYHSQTEADTGIRSLQKFLRETTSPDPSMSMKAHLALSDLYLRAGAPKKAAFHRQLAEDIH